MGSVQIPVIIIITTALTLGPACLLAELSPPGSNDSPKLGLGACPYSTEVKVFFLVQTILQNWGLGPVLTPLRKVTRTESTSEECGQRSLLAVTSVSVTEIR